MSISASDVKELRERTGAGMMDCKKALAENNGDLEAAAEYLRVKGIAKADKKADRVAAEGLVAAWVSDDGRTAAMVEVNCETDFVARNEEFLKFCEDLAAHAAGAAYDSLDAFLGSAFQGATVEDVRRNKIASIGENITVRRFERVALTEPGVVGAYIHGGGKIGVLTVFKANGDALGAMDAARDVAMHVAAMSPLFGRTDEIDDETVERERRVLTEQALESGKPREIVDKMIVGRLAKWKKEICLVDQPFVKDGEVTVGDYVVKTGKEIGVDLQFDRFVRYERGEGIEKVVSNLADEVAAQLK